MNDLDISNKNILIKSISLICFIISLIYIVIHCYRVGIGLEYTYGMGYRRFYSGISLAVHLLFPLVISLLVYFIRKRRIAFLNIFFIITSITTAFAFITTYL
jgi:hypothetical protein